MLPLFRGWLGRLFQQFGFGRGEDAAGEVGEFLAGGAVVAWW